MITEFEGTVPMSALNVLTLLSFRSYWHMLFFRQLTQKGKETPIASSAAQPNKQNPYGIADRILSTYTTHW